MSDSDVRQAAGRSAKRRIQEGYLWSKTARHVEQVYLEMMGWKGFPTGSSEVITIRGDQGSAA
jgi:hypothetical protein